MPTMAMLIARFAWEKKKSFVNAGFRFAAIAALVGIATLNSPVQAQAQQTRDPAPASSGRPPQFVLLAFDGSYNNSMWRETRQFARDLEQSLGKSVKFTYFINASYYIPNANTVVRNTYKAPGKTAGKSAIGWGGELADTKERIALTMGAQEEGHELASHAVGHFNADEDRWKQGDWETEFRDFNRFMYGYLDLNRVTSLLFEGRDIIGKVAGWLERQLKFVGFRAPQLGRGQGLWETLNANGFRYDTSKSRAAKGGLYQWPSRNPEAGGFWDFPLAEIPFHGDFREVTVSFAGQSYRVLIGKKPMSLIHSMDYNFYANQNNIRAVDGDSSHSLRTSGQFAKALESSLATLAPVLKNEMLESYRAYFNRAYASNRAPVHIGHHFSKWNHGIYWEAMKEFATEVCSKPDVRCVTYRELADYMDAIERQPGFIAENRISAPMSALISSDQAVVAVEADGNGWSHATRFASPSFMLPPIALGENGSAVVDVADDDKDMIPFDPPEAHMHEENQGL